MPLSCLNDAMFTIKAMDFPTLASDKRDSLNWKPSPEQKSILESGSYLCQCCGLQSRSHREYPSGYVEVVVIDDVRHLLCTMCAQSQYLSRPVNGKKNHGLVIYCPSLSQGQIIKCAQWAYIAKYRHNKYEMNANALIGMITKDLIAPVEKIIPGFTSGDVIEFADIYKNMSPLLKNNSDRLFQDLRYWPNEVVFEKQIKFWNVAAFHELTDDLEASCKVGSSNKKSA